MLHNLGRRYRQGIPRNLCEVLLKACLTALRGSSKPITLGWRYPLHEWLKFNVSGLATEEAMGCGGVLRDEEGNIGWRGIGLTIVEIGSLVAYNWLLNKDKRLWSQQTTFVDMERRLACVGEVALSKAESHGNEMAETLASVGINRKVMFKAWW
ncbi:hypothetical protein Goari_006439 [Gossypium aridum]|uniref:RNase H type-1 domain-containing protein n=2 Tax=Gossypium TaxID=3633 RepID=A0A7J8XMW4_GOSAI|nr:hypothetical protein [Gossypium aridum]